MFPIAYGRENIQEYGHEVRRYGQGNAPRTGRRLPQRENIMRISSSVPRSLLLAGAFIGVLSCGAAAQTPSPAAPAAAQPLPPGSPMIGRPDNEAAQKLAPNAPPSPLATAADKLPLDKLKVPAGFNIEVYAAGMANARSLALGDKGTVFVGSRTVDKV